MMKVLVMSNQQRIRAVASIVIVLLVLALVLGLLSAAFYFRFTREYASGDYFVYWYATRALVRDGRDPYSATITSETREILPLIEIPSSSDGLFIPEYVFVNPLYAVLPIVPLVWLAFDAAEAIWLAFLLSVLLGSGVLLLRETKFRLTPVTVGVALLWIVLFYPATHSLLNGQLSMLVFGCVVGAWWALRHEHDTLAGLLLAYSTVKIQMVVLLVPLLLLWAIHQRRTRLLFAFSATLGMMLAWAFAMDARWPLGMLNNVTAHAGDFLSPSALQVVMPNPALSTALSIGLLLMFALAVARSVLRGWQALGELPMWAIMLTCLLVVHASPHDQLMLLLPIWQGIAQQSGSHARLKTLVLMSLFMALPWGVSLATKRGHLESYATLLPLSIGVISWRAIAELRRTSRA